MNLKDNDIRDPQPTDKELIRERFHQKFGEYDRLAETQRCICHELAAEVHTHIPGPITRALEIGAGTGFLTADLIRRYPSAKWFLNDLVPEAEAFLSRYASGNDVEWLWGDAEKIDFPANLDLITSSCTVQWFSDMKGFAARAAAATKSGGWLALTTFGPDNFREIRATTDEGLDYLSEEELGVIFRDTGYKVVILRNWHEILRLDDPAAVLRHIKETGVNSVKKAKWGHDRFDRFNADYKRLFSTEDAGVTLTFHPIIMLAQKL